jgi:hypothetical protein
MRAINVVGAAHVGEWESEALLYELWGQEQAARVQGEPKIPVRAITAYNDGCGFDHTEGENLVFATPNSAPTASRRDRRMAELVALSHEAYATFDAHQILDHGLRTAYIDSKRGVTPVVLGFLYHRLGITSLVATDGWGLQAHGHNTALLDSRYQFGDERSKTAQAIRRFSVDPDPPTAQAEDFRWFRYAGAFDTTTFPPPRRRETSLKPLQEMPEGFAAAVGLEGLALYTLNWRDKPIRGSEVWGEFVERISVPNTQGWQKEPNLAPHSFDLTGVRRKEMIMSNTQKVAS